MATDIPNVALQPSLHDTVTTQCHHKLHVRLQFHRLSSGPLRHAVTMHNCLTAFPCTVTIQRQPRVHVQSVSILLYFAKSQPSRLSLLTYFDSSFRLHHKLHYIN
jgi:hypothetical protein